jgi:hypothetical protein
VGAVAVDVDQGVVAVEGRESERRRQRRRAWWLVLTFDDSGCVLCNTQPPRTVCRVKTYLGVVCLCSAVVSCLVATVV